MNIRVLPGKYVVAVSGGVDSVVLLDLLSKKKNLHLVVAHFDHGIRDDSAEDRKLVQKLAKHYGLPVVYRSGNLGADASEATAREARYTFLRQTMHAQKAQAIITAHHQDDMLETAIINMLRGTGRKGLSSLINTKELKRPMLRWRKSDVLAYAREHKLAWYEDSTNADERYLRNYIRKHILSRFTEPDRDDLLRRIEHAGKINKQIDQLLAEDLAQQPAPDELNRMWYLQLPFAVAKEMMATWLRRNGVTNFDRSLIEQLVIAAKTAAPGKQADIDKAHNLQFTKEKISLRGRD